MTDPVMKVRDMELPVTMNVSRDGLHGAFVVRLEDVNYQAETFEGLRQKVMRETKRPNVKVAVPAMRLTKDWHAEAGWKFESFVATGLHGSTGKVLTDDGVGADYKAYTADLTAEQQAERARLAKVSEDVSKAIRKFDADHEFNVASAVRQAIEEKLDTEVAL